MSISPVRLEKLPQPLLETIQDFLPMEKIASDVHRLCTTFAHVWPSSGHLDFSESEIDGNNLKKVLNQYQEKRICRSLNLSDCPNIKDEDLEQLKQLSHLEQLNLSGCPLTDKGVQSLKALSSLKHLDLIDCRKITDRTSLNELSGSVHYNFSDCPKLQTLAPFLPKNPTPALKKKGTCIIL
jgi:Leucine Rich repeat